MPKLQILGAVLPLATKVTCGMVPSISINTEEGLHIQIDIEIQEGHITATCEIVGMAPDDLSYVCMRVLDACRVPVNLVAFSRGSGLSIHLHTIIHETGDQTEIVPEIPWLGGLCTAYKTPTTNAKELAKIVDLYSLIVTNDNLALALNDLIESVAHPHYGPINCARALDGIRHFLAPGMPNEDGWIKVQETLNCSRSYSTFISKASRPGRHGDHDKTEREEGEESLRRTWNLMNRLLHYFQNGRQPLSQVEFPFLDEPSS